MRQVSPSRGQDAGEPPRWLCPLSSSSPRSSKGLLQPVTSCQPCPGTQAPTAEDGTHSAHEARLRLKAVFVTENWAQPSRRNGGEEKVSEVARLAGGRATTRAQREQHTLPSTPPPGTGPRNSERWSFSAAAFVRQALPGATGVTTGPRNQPLLPPGLFQARAPPLGTGPVALGPSSCLSLWRAADPRVQHRGQLPRCPS